MDKHIKIFRIVYPVVLIIFTLFVILKAFVIKSSVTVAEDGGIYSSVEDEDAEKGKEDEKASDAVRNSGDDKNEDTSSGTDSETEEDSGKKRRHGKGNGGSGGQKPDFGNGTRGKGGPGNKNRSEEKSGTDDESSVTGSGSGTGSGTVKSGSETADTSGSTGTTSSLTAEDLTYTDGNGEVTIKVKQIREYDTEIFIADIQLTDITHLRTAFADDTFGRNIKEQTSDIADEAGAVLAVNGDFYGARDTGLVIRNGTLYRESSKKSDEDVGLLYDDGSFRIVAASEVSGEELIADGVVQAWSFGPGLVSDSKVTVTENDEVDMAMASNPRTAIGMISPMHFVLVATEGRTEESEGLSLYQLALVMQEYGCTEAYNLDGGGSTTMYYKGQILNDTVGGRGSSERKVSDIVYIK